MSMTGLEYDTKIEIARNSFSAVRDQMVARIIPLEDELAASEPWNISYEPEPNMIDIVRALTVRLQTIDDLGALHRFAKLDESQRDRLLAGEGVHRVVGTATYKVTQWDTTQSLSDKFGISWRDIAQYNEITALDLEANLEIEIPIPKTDGNALTIFKNNPVYDAHIGVRALGSDMANDIEAGEDGDFAILANVETFMQGLVNIINTAPGEIPGYPSWGLNNIIGEDMPQMAKDEFVKFRVRDALDQEPRIEQIVSIDASKHDSGYDVKVVVKPINHPKAEDFEDYIPFGEEE